jgi:hypothetical protein
VRPAVILANSPAPDCRRVTGDLGAALGEAIAGVDLDRAAQSQGSATLDACASGTAVPDQIDRA